MPVGQMERRQTTGATHRFRPARNVRSLRQLIRFVTGNDAQRFHRPTGPGKSMRSSEPPVNRRAEGNAKRRVAVRPPAAGGRKSGLVEERVYTAAGQEHGRARCCFFFFLYRTSIPPQLVVTRSGDRRIVPTRMMTTVTPVCGARKTAGQREKKERRRERERKRGKVDCNKFPPALRR